MGKILIIPDIHSRDFYKDAIGDISMYDKVVFLGDYLDGYPYEGVSNETGFSNLLEIIDFKKKNKDKVVLLLGNHDAHYLNRLVNSGRFDFLNAERNAELFEENLGLFDVAWETEINGKRYFFSHAGVRRGWIESNHDLFVLDDTSTLPSADYFNNFLHAGEQSQADRFFVALSNCSYHRGGWGDSGSMVWSDIHEYFSNRGVVEEHEYDGVYFIVGHTQQEQQPIITDYVACLDVRRPFVLGEDGVIYEMDGTKAKLFDRKPKTDEEIEEERRKLEEAMAFFL